MKKIIMSVIIPIICIALALPTSAQTYFYDYQYSVTPDGAKIKEDFPLQGYKIMTFSNNKNFVQVTNSSGVASTNSGFRYSYSEDGFNVYKPSNTGGNSTANQLGNAWYKSAADSAFGYHVVAVSFGNNNNTLLLHLSNGNNMVLKRKSDPNKIHMRH